MRVNAGAALNNAFKRTRTLVESGFEDDNYL